MQIEIQNTKKDYINFFRLVFFEKLRNKAALIIILSLIIASSLSGKYFEWLPFIIITIFIPVIFCSLIYVISYFKVLYDLRKSKSIGKDPTDKKILSITEGGLNINYSSTGLNKLLTWNRIISANTTESATYLVLDNKSFFLITSHHLSPAEINDFSAEINKHLNKGPLWFEYQTRKKPPYWMGWLCLIPLIGGIVGIVLIINGIFKYKNIKLIAFGTLGLAFTVAIYSSIYFYSRSNKGRSGFAPFAQSDLNNLMKNIEFYKMQHGTYPDSLMQLKAKDDFLSINDPIQDFVKNKKPYYNYKKVGNKYYLFSSGVDGIPNTKDDIYPDIDKIDTSRIGLIIK